MYVGDIVAANVADETTLGADSLHDIMQDLRENPDDTVAIIIGVAIVEFLEVIQVRVAHRELIAGREAPLYFGFDLHRAWQARGRMHGQVAV